MSWLDIRTSSVRLACLWQVVAWLCCIFTVYPATSRAIVFPVGMPPAYPLDAEGEERPTAPEDEDSEGAAGKEGNSGLAARRSRQRMRGHATVPLAWLTHLPHHHIGTPGYSLPICSPFERGAHLPLRC